MSNKKLSLEERLSLAAKKGKKKSKASKNVNSPNSSVQSSFAELAPSRSKDSEEQTNEIKSIDNIIVMEPEYQETTEDGENDASVDTKEEISTTEYNELPTELSLFKTWLPDNYSKLNAYDLLMVLKPHIETTMKRNPVHVDSGLMKLVKEKDQTIEDITADLTKLQTENEKFKEEMKLLVQKVNKLENVNKSLKSDMKDKNNSIKQLQNDIINKNITIKELNETFEDTSVLQNDLREKNDTIESLKDNVNKLEITVNALNQDIKEERALFDKEKNIIKEATRDQVTTLESKLEQLRIELENTTIANKDNNNESAVDANSDLNSPSFSKESSSWEKQYNILQEEFNSSKADWNSIEFTLNSKIADLQREYDASTTEITKLKSQCDENCMMIQKLKSELTIREKTINEDKFKITLLSNEKSKLENLLQETNDDYNLLQKKYNIQKEQLANNISSVKIPEKENDARSLSPLNEEPSINGNNIESSIKSSIGGGNNDTHTIVSGDNQDPNEIIRNFENEWSLSLPEGANSIHEPRNFSITEDPTGMAEMNTSFNSENLSIISSGHHMNDIPDTLTNLDSFFLNKRNNSAPMLNLGRTTNMTHLLNRIPSVSDATGLFISPTETFGNNKENTTVTSNGSNQVPAHLVSRLGAEVRRMEGELSSLQIAYDKLKSEKNSTNEELLKLMEENEKVESFKEAKDDLQAKVDELEKQLETALQLLGEKTELAEELENDVEDLKEMMQQQVQQMIQLQESMR
ncbi:protein Sgm1p [Monosporozyma servazzii]